MTVEKPKRKQLLRPITTRAVSAMNQSQFLAITCNSLEAREKSRVYGVIGFGFDSHWLKNWRESFKPITKLSNRNYGITFDSHLKTALLMGASSSDQSVNHSVNRFDQCIDRSINFYAGQRQLDKAESTDWRKMLHSW